MPDSERISELTRELAVTRAREVEFRQAAFDLNTELVRKDEEIERLREQVAAAEARVAEVEGLLQTRAVRAATWWWRVKAFRPR